MIVDPLSSDPLVISGSANFNKASTERNHENMILERNPLRLCQG
jgi:phosphatidylserine/phosphatidylglycerophosphate/cardiolipin synthase-like enzyme